MITLQHVLVSSLSNGENVRWDFITSLALVDFHGTRGVDGKSDVRVDGDTEEARVGLCTLSGRKYYKL